MNKVIISGVNGFIGHALAKKLLERNITVYGIGFNFVECDRSIESKNFIPIELNFKEYRHIKQYLPDDIDTFFHFAWGGGFEQNTLRDYRTQMENVTAACDAMVSTIELGIQHFVYAGTINEVEIQQFINHFDNFQTRPTCIYATAKLSVELICRTLAQENHVHYNAGLVPMVYGIGNRSKQLMNIVMNDLISGREPRLIEGNNQYDIVHIDDVARAFDAIGEKGIDGKRYYIGHQKLKSFRQWMEELRDVVAPGVNLRFNEYPDPLNLDYSLLDLYDLYNDTGFVCKDDFSEHIKKTAIWLRGQKEM